MHPLIRTHGLPLVILVAFVGADIGLASVSTVAITGWLKPNLIALTFLGLTLCCVALRPPHRVTEILFYLCTWAVFSAAGCIFTYLVASHGGPLADGRLLAMDHAIGFDWFAWSGWVHDHPGLAAILHAAYASLPWQIVGSITLLAFRTGGRNAELLLCAAIALGITTVVAAALPAAGPWSADTVGRPDFALMTKHVMALRGGASRFTLNELIGIVWFPSFHATLAILLTYCNRGLVWTVAPFAALNIVMLLSVPSEGGHYLTDVLGGGGVALVSIAAARWVLLRWRRDWSDAIALAAPIPPSLHGAEHP